MREVEEVTSMVGLITGPLGTGGEGERERKRERERENYNSAFLDLNEVYTVQRKTFEGENFHEFRGFKATHESFLHEIWVCHTYMYL